jgi:hypothetical protein
MLRIGIKAIVLILVANLCFAVLNPISSLSQISLYNTVFPGRPRLPYGDDPSLSFNVTVNQLDALW